MPMTAYRPGEGFGQAGLVVTDAGYTYRFQRPVSRVVIKNVSEDGQDVYIGFNQVIEGGDGNDPVLTENQEANRVQTITAAQALARGVFLDAGNNEVIEAPIDPVHGHRGIYSIWIVVAPGGQGRVQGGVVGQ